MRAPADEVGVGRRLELAVLGPMGWTDRGVGTAKRGSSS